MSVGDSRRAGKSESGSNGLAASRLEAIASQVAPPSISKDDTNVDVDVKSSRHDVVDGARPPFQLEDHPIDDHRNLKVAVIGAGIGGINAGILLPAKVPSITLTIFEKNLDVSGTWLQNIYPGVRCDIPAHAYQSTFAPNTQWSEEFAEGAEIRAYWQSVAKQHNVYQYIKFGKKILRAEWHAEDAEWGLTIQDAGTGQVLGEERFDVLITAIGHFDDWKLPAYPGMADFKGPLRHSSNWDPEFDPRGKRIATIGNGASGIQVTTALQKVASRLDHYARNPTWIAGSFAGDERKPDPNLYTPNQLEEFRDPEKYLAFRKNLESTYWKNFQVLFKNSPRNISLKQEFKDLMTTRLAAKPELISKIIPDFSPHCRRLTPGPGYLEAITSSNVDFVSTPIKRFTASGIETIDGKIREVDAIICATGANTDFAPPFSIIADGVDLKEAWKPDGKFGFPLTYLGIATPGFPNLFFVNGPIASGFSGTVPHSIENQVTYIARILRKISSQGILTIAPSAAATSEFIEYCDAFFPTTVLSEDCKSWSNGGIAGARIHGHWPGSAAHVTHVRREPRWEDFDYGYGVGGRNRGNRFGYFGNGWTRKEMVEGSDLTGYLRREGSVDLRGYHEGWFDV